MIRVLEQDLELMPYPSPWGSGRWSYSGIPLNGILKTVLMQLKVKHLLLWKLMKAKSLIKRAKRKLP